MIELFQQENIQDKMTKYAFRSNKDQLYLGYDGFDTDFYRGVSPFIKEHELARTINDKLYTVTHDVLVSMLINRAKHEKEWIRMGGFDNLTIVKLEMVIDGTAYEPLEMINNINNKDVEDDYDEFGNPYYEQPDD